MSFDCERNCSSARRVLNFRSNVPRGGGGYLPHILFVGVAALSSSGLWADSVAMLKKYLLFVFLTKLWPERA